jgi:hypothetical protein
MGLTSAHLDVIDLTPRIGSELRTDLDTLLSGQEAEHIRTTLESRLVIFFRGLTISDEQQVTIAKTLGNIVQSGCEDGIYKISLDKDVNERAQYLTGTMFWHFDASLEPCPNLAAVLRAVKVSETGGQTEFCNTYAAYDDFRTSGGPQCGAVTVLRETGDELRRGRVLAEVAHQQMPVGVDAPIGPQVPTSRRDSGLRGRDSRGGEPRAARAPSRLGHPAPVCLSARLAGGRSADLEQHRHHAPGGAVPRRQRPTHALHDPCGRRALALKLGIATPVVTNVGGGALEWDKDVTVEDIGRVAETADRLGYHHMTCSEHIGLPSTETARRGFGTGIRLPRSAMRRPAQNGTLDHVSGGWAILGVGVEQFDLLGAPFYDRGAGGDDALRALRTVLPRNEPAPDVVVLPVWRPDL